MNDWTLLIDFGTSYSRAAIADADGRTEPIEVDGHLAVPSGIWADSGGRLVTGVAAQRQARLAPERWDRAPGRWIGRPGPLRLGQFEVDPVTAYAEVLRRLRTEATARRGKQPPTGVRLTCPARWDAGRREVLLAAARRAGLGSPPLQHAPQLVDQPVAAALRLAALGRFPVGAVVALYSLGGGSTETAVVESTPDGVRVRALGGIDGVGGELFDDLLYRQVIAHAVTDVDAEVAHRLWEPPDAQWRRAGEDLFREVRRAKEELSQQHAVTLDTGQLVGTPVRLSRFELEGVLRPYVLRSARELAATVELAGLRPRQLDAILVIGGSGRMPLVSRAIYDVTGVQPQLAPDLVDEPGPVTGAAGWSPPTAPAGSAAPFGSAGEAGSTAPTGSAIGPAAPITVIGRQSGEEAAAAAAAAAAATAATGSIDLSALAAPRPPAASPQPLRQPAASSLWRRRWPLIALAAVVLVVGGLILNGPASGDDDGGPEDGPTRPVPGATPTGSGTATATATTPIDELGAADLAAVTGLRVKVRSISVDLSWTEVPDAEGYTVYRDAGTPDQTLRTVPGTTLTDRPGDGDQHTYSVVAVDADDRQGPSSATVTATAEAPYGDVQDIASSWTAVVPVTPGRRGTAGQTCRPVPGPVGRADGRITCQYQNGIRFVLYRFAFTADRDLRTDELAAGAGVDDGRWGAAPPRGSRLTGRLVVSDSQAAGGPWRWWTYDAAPAFGLYVQWPKRSAKDLEGWWRSRAPFRF